MTDKKTDWANELGIGIVALIVLGIIVVLIWLALKHICGVEDPSPVVEGLLVALVLLRVFAFLTPRRVKDQLRGGGQYPAVSTAAGALAAIVKATGNDYHPAMTTGDVAVFIRRLAFGYRQAAARGMSVCLARIDEQAEREIWSLEVIAPENAEDAVDKEAL